MKEYYNYDRAVLKSLNGMVLSSLLFVEDFRWVQSIGASYNPFSQQFLGANLVIWYYKGNDHFTLRLYCTENGRFVSVENGEDKMTWYGVRSIGVKSNEDLLFFKHGAIQARRPNRIGFGIDGIGVIQRIKLYQEVRDDLLNQGNRTYPKLSDNSYFPDRWVIESENMYLVIRAEEDYDQNLLFRCRIGKLSSSDEYFNSGYDDHEGYQHILIDEI
jgi:hypothetical protein